MARSPTTKPGSCGSLRPAPAAARLLASIILTPGARGTTTRMGRFTPPFWRPSMAGITQSLGRAGCEQRTHRLFCESLRLADTDDCGVEHDQRNERAGVRFGIGLYRPRLRADAGVLLLVLQFVGGRSGPRVGRPFRQWRRHRLQRASSSRTSTLLARFVAAGEGWRIRLFVDWTL